MPARKRRDGQIWHPEEVRARIQATMLINRLHDHIFGKLKKQLSVSQVRAIDILLKKCIPDLSSTTVTADFNFRYVAELPPMLTRAEWEAKYGSTQIEVQASPTTLAITDGSGTGNGKLQ